MALELVLRLEKQIDRMLERQQEMEQELRLLREEKAGLLNDRERIRAELDRILDKLDSLAGESS